MDLIHFGREGVEINYPIADKFFAIMILSNMVHLRRKLFIKSEMRWRHIVTRFSNI